MGNEKKPVGPPPDNTRGEVAEGIARAAVSAVPVVGGPAAELLGLVVDAPLHRRYRAWLERLAAVVDDLQAHGLDVRSLEDNDAFITVLTNATQAAGRTHDQEKLDALRNAIANSALPTAPQEHEQMMFVRFVDEFTGMHLRILALLRDPAGWFQSRGLVRPNLIMGSRTAVLEAGLPELQGHSDTYMLAVNELAARGLENGSVSGIVTEQGLWQALTTQLGNRFLDFVSRPK